MNTPPSGIGTPEVLTFYSGPRDLFEELAPTLEVLTGTDYRGADQGLAALYYQIGMDLFWTTMLSWVHALAIAEANGISAAEFLPYASQSTGGMSRFFEFYSPRIDAGEFPGDVDRLAMGVASVEHVLHTTRAAGVDTALPEAVLELFRRGAEAGHADDSFTSLFAVMREPDGCLRRHDKRLTAPVAPYGWCSSEELRSGGVGPSIPKMRTHHEEGM